MQLRVFAAVLMAVLLGSCASDRAAAPSPYDERAVEAVVRTSVKAENAKDVDAFLKLWTDEGLKEYDVGSREELRSGKSENFGAEKATLHRFVDTAVTDGKATATVDASPSGTQVATPLYRLRFELIARNDEWLLNGFEFLGGPPPDEGTELLDVKAQEYAFVLERAGVSREVAFNFRNVGKEPHEITLFKGPDDVDIEKASTDLKDVDGSELDNVPAGYEVDHIAFAEPGKKSYVTFAKPLPAGTYVLACYIPQGGFEEEGEGEHGHEEGEQTGGEKPKPHFQLGMRALLTVE